MLSLCETRIEKGAFNYYVHPSANTTESVFKEYMTENFFVSLLGRAFKVMKNVVYLILHFPIPHNALCLPPKFCINYCCGMLLGICRPPKSISQQ